MASPDFYETLHRRRDVRGQFTGEPIPAAMLGRILAAAHAAPSVGLSQPWDFVLVDDASIKRRFWSHVQEERARFSDSLPRKRAELFANLKIDGVLESSLS